MSEDIKVTDGTILESLNNKVDLDGGNYRGSRLEELIKTNTAVKSMFDTKLTDHILSFEESQGWGLQGTYVYKEAITGERFGYPDFYNKCVEEFENEGNTPLGLPWTQPALSANGTMGGNSFAVSSNRTQYSACDVYGAFDGSTVDDNKLFHTEQGVTTGYIDIYNPIPLNITNFTIWNQGNANRASSAGVIYGSDNGSDWIQITTYTNSVQTASGTWDIDLSSNTKYYKYYRIESASGGSDSYWTIKEIKITATQQLGVKHSNGHLFYDIADKASIDEIYNTYGIAWYYGIDKENKRIFLPRTKYCAFTGGVMGNGMTLGLTNGENNIGLCEGASNYLCAGTGQYGTNVGVLISGNPGDRDYTIGITTDSTKSGIIAEPDETKYLYICVGNLISDISWIDVVTQVDNGVKDINDAKNNSIEDIETVTADCISSVEHAGVEIINKTAFSMFDTKLVDRVLSYTESRGWALQGTYVYKEAVAGSRYGYPDFYQKCVKEYGESEDYIVFDPYDNVNINGTLTSTNGVLTGFSAGNYAITKSDITLDGDTWEIVTNFKLPSSVTNNVANNIIYPKDTATKGVGIYARFTADGIYVYMNISSDGVTNDIANNYYDSTYTNTLKASKKYTAKLYFTGSEYKLDISEDDGNTYINHLTVASDVKISWTNPITLGFSTTSTTAVNIESIDLNKCYVKNNDSIIWKGTAGEGSIKKHSNGHIFYDITSKGKIDDFYANDGIAWYYGIDKENERIFLPRTKHFAFTGGVMGNGMALGFTNGSIDTYIMGWDNTYGVNSNFSSSGGVVGENKASSAINNGAGNLLGITTDPTKSGITLETDDSKYLYICVGNTNVESAVTDVVDVTTTENDTVPLFTGMYFDFTPNNVSWLKAGQQANSGGIYTFTYNELVNILNGETKYGDLKVINVADMVTGEDYSLYWKVNQTDMTFITPTAISNKALSGGVMGNGMALGLTDGTTNTGLRWSTSVSVSADVNSYGTNVGGSTGGHTFGKDESLGITTDPTKSGIVAEQSTSQLYFKVANAVQNLELLDVGEVLESLADKISRQDCKTYVTETYVNGASWYRVYSDGWCEQGGYVDAQAVVTTTISLLKSYKNTNYNISLTNSTSVTTNKSSPHVTSATTSSFTYWNENANGDVYWQASGYIA